MPRINYRARIVEVLSVSPEHDTGEHINPSENHGMRSLICGEKRREDIESLDEPAVTREKKHGLDGATRIGLKREKNGSNGHY